MPESALAIAGADFVLPVREMAAKVHELIESIDRSADVAGPQPATDLPLELKSIAEVPTVLPSVFSCPDCGGVLWEQQDGDVTSFRCRIGHAYAPESLFDAQYETVEASVRMAIRVLEEQSDLAERLERRARALDKHLVADRFARERDEATGKAAVLRRLIDDVRELINAPGADVA
jgi:two-component system chemotaxis response regulator CheB